MAELVNKVTIDKDLVIELKKSNRVEFVGENPTLWLVTLDHAPMGRYCPRC
jgi:hypothetical protein